MRILLAMAPLLKRIYSHQELLDVNFLFLFLFFQKRTLIRISQQTEYSKVHLESTMGSIYIQHGGTTPKPTKKNPTKLTRPLSTTKLKQTPFYTISTHPNVLFYQLYLYIYIPCTILGAIGGNNHLGTWQFLLCLVKDLTIMEEPPHFNKNLDLALSASSDSP